MVVTATMSPRPQPAWTTSTCCVWPPRWRPTPSIHWPERLWGPPPATVLFPGRRTSVPSPGAWAAGYNVLAIPVAAGVLAWAGFTLPRAVGAVLMSVSTMVVALNAQLLRHLDL